MAQISTITCPITDLQAHDEPTVAFAGRYYTIMPNEHKSILINLPQSFDHWSKGFLFQENRYILAGAILNDKLPKRKYDGAVVLEEPDIPELLKNIVYPGTPQEKLDNLFETLVNLQHFDGSNISFHSLAKDPGFFYSFYFKTFKELNFYMNTLLEMGYIKFPGKQDMTTAEGVLMTIVITFKGLQYYLQLKSSGKQSKKCFIAMAFADEFKNIRNAIKSAIEKTGYQPDIIDEVPIDSDKTINDAIISHLREAKFCIADFTDQRTGVYFESGFALGLGRQVIYTCHEKDFKNIHFDLNHFPHIIYETPEELEARLIDRIKAWIQ
jgi:hypothetical protein